MEVAELREGIVVGIFMGLADVHVNRAPIAGVVKRIVHTRRRPSMSMWRMTINDILGKNAFPVPGQHVVKNTRNAVLIEGEFPVCVLQIADRHVGRILCYPKEGQEVVAGERIGMITFGSQVDLFLPKDKYALSVKVGDRVKAGSSIIARLIHEPIAAGL